MNRRKYILGLRSKTWLSILAVVIIISPAVYAFRSLRLERLHPKIVYAKVLITPTPAPALLANANGDPERIKFYIKKVFGKYAGRAFLILRGKECHENLYLNPKAVNDNSQWGGVGKDYGIFQLNNIYQKVNNIFFLEDYKTNIDMAWVIFKNSGYNFHLWTCGRYYSV